MEAEIVEFEMGSVRRRCAPPRARIRFFSILTGLNDVGAQPNKKLPRGGARMRDDEREVQLFFVGSGHIFFAGFCGILAYMGVM